MRRPTPTSTARTATLLTAATLLGACTAPHGSTGREPITPYSTSSAPTDWQATYATVDRIRRRTGTMGAGPRPRPAFDPEQPAFLITLRSPDTAARLPLADAQRFTAAAQATDATLLSFETVPLQRAEDDELPGGIRPGDLNAHDAIRIALNDDESDLIQRATEAAAIAFSTPGSSPLAPGQVRLAVLPFTATTPDGEDRAFLLVYRAPFTHAEIVPLN